MNRLDDVDWWAEQCQLLSCDRGYYSGTVRQLVAVARAVVADNGRTASARRIREALAPLLTNKDGASHGVGL